MGGTRRARRTRKRGRALRRDNEEGKQAEFAEVFHVRARMAVTNELGISPSLMSRAYHELAYLGLVKKSGRGWVAVERDGGGDV